MNHYRPQIQSKLRDRLGRDVSLGPMGLSLVPLAFRVENAVIAEDTGFNTGRPFAQVQTLFVSPELLPLLHHEIQIKSLQLGRPAVELVTSEAPWWTSRRHRLRESSGSANSRIFRSTAGVSTVAA